MGVIIVIAEKNVIIPKSIPKKMRANLKQVRVIKAKRIAKTTNIAKKAKVSRVSVFQ